MNTKDSGRKDRFFEISRIVLSGTVALLAILKMLGIWENAIFGCIPLLTALLLVLAAQEWRQHRRLAITGICLAVILVSLTATALLR